MGRAPAPAAGPAASITRAKSSGTRAGAFRREPLARRQAPGASIPRGSREPRAPAARRPQDDTTISMVAVLAARPRRAELLLLLAASLVFLLLAEGAVRLLGADSRARPATRPSTRTAGPCARRTRTGTATASAPYPKPPGVHRVRLAGRLVRLGRERRVRGRLPAAARARPRPPPRRALGGREPGPAGHEHGGPGRAARGRGPGLRARRGAARVRAQRQRRRAGRRGPARGGLAAGAARRSAGLLDRSALFRLVRSAAVGHRREPPPRRRLSSRCTRTTRPAGSPRARRLEVAWAPLCRERGVPFVVAIFPLFGNPLDDAYPFAEVHRKVARGRRPRRARGWWTCCPPTAACAGSCWSWTAWTTSTPTRSPTASPPGVILHALDDVVPWTPARRRRRRSTATPAADEPAAVSRAGWASSWPSALAGPCACGSSWPPTAWWPTSCATARSPTHVLDVSWNPYQAPRLYPYPPVWMWVEAGSGLAGARHRHQLPGAREAARCWRPTWHRRRAAGARRRAARARAWLYALHPGEPARRRVPRPVRRRRAVASSSWPCVRSVAERLDRSALALAAAIGAEVLPRPAAARFLLARRPRARAASATRCSATGPVALLLLSRSPRTTPARCAASCSATAASRTSAGSRSCAACAGWPPASSRASEAAHWPGSVLAAKVAVPRRLRGAPGRWSRAAAGAPDLAARLPWPSSSAFLVFYGAISAQYLLWVVPLGALLSGACVRRVQRGRHRRRSLGVLPVPGARRAGRPERRPARPRAARRGRCGAAAAVARGAPPGWPAR